MKTLSGKQLKCICCDQEKDVCRKCKTQTGKKEHYDFWRDMTGFMNCYYKPYLDENNIVKESFL